MPESDLILDLGGQTLPCVMGNDLGVKMECLVTID